MAGISRFNSFEDVEWAQESFMQGYEARMLGRDIDAGPKEDLVGRWCHRSWRAGWADAEMSILSDRDAELSILSDCHAPADPEKEKSDITSTPK